VTPGATADSTGLVVGDVITGIKVGLTSLKIADLKVPAQVVSSVVDQFPAGTELQVLRDGRTVTLRLSLQRHPVSVARLGIDAAAGPEALAIRRGIFGS
jgi:C-terminal processing protease CtpA/Prc